MGRRCSARTRQPLRKSARATSPPTPPVAPSTRAVRLLLIEVSPFRPCPVGVMCSFRRILEIVERRTPAIHFRMAKAAEPGWDLYRSFLAVLRAGSLSGAARALKLTQPTIGRHISELEATLGTALFTRSQHGLMPTEAALELEPHAEAMASSAAALIRAASGASQEVRGTVRLSASEVISVEVLPPMLASLRARHPRLTSSSLSPTKSAISCAAMSILRSATCAPRKQRWSPGRSARSPLGCMPIGAIWRATERRALSTIYAAMR